VHVLPVVSLHRL